MFTIVYLQTGLAIYMEVTAGLIVWMSFLRDVKFSGMNGRWHTRGMKVTVHDT